MRLSIGARTPNCRWEGRRAREIGRGWTVNAATCAGVDGGVSSRAAASGPPYRTPRRGRSPPTKTWRFAARRSRFGIILDSGNGQKNGRLRGGKTKTYRLFEVLARNPRIHWTYERKIIGIQDDNRLRQREGENAGECSTSPV